MVSRGTFVRNGVRPVALVFLAHQSDLIAVILSLTKKLRACPARSGASSQSLRQFRQFRLIRVGCWPCFKGLILITHCPVGQQCPTRSASSLSTAGFAHRRLRHRHTRACWQLSGPLVNDPDVSLLAPAARDAYSANDSGPSSHQAISRGWFD